MTSKWTEFKKIHYVVANARKNAQLKSVNWILWKFSVLVGCICTNMSTKKDIEVEQKNAL